MIGGGKGKPRAGAWWARVRPSKASPVAGLMLVFGCIVGAGPASDVTAIGCFCGMMGSCMVNGVVGGLAHWPDPPREKLVCAHALRPSFAARYPALVRRPILNRSRRLNPARMISCRFLNAAYIFFHCDLEILLPCTSKYMVVPPSKLKVVCLPNNPPPSLAWKRMRSDRDSATPMRPAFATGARQKPTPHVRRPD